MRDRLDKDRFNFNFNFILILILISSLFLSHSIFIVHLFYKRNEQPREKWFISTVRMGYVLGCTHTLYSPSSRFRSTPPCIPIVI